MLLSVIIPCYKETQAELMRCLDSLAFLSDMCEWEAWIVDDGSPDNMVAQWVSERCDAHLHTIRQDNQGLSVARNAGIDRAQGEYIAFLDADDEWIAPQYAQLIRLLMREKPDILGLRYKSTPTPYYDGQAAAFMAAHDVVPSACAYIIRREALGPLSFTPGIYHEDEEFVTRLHLLPLRLIMTPIVAYRYHIRQGSTITTRSESHLNKRFDDLLGVIERMSKERQDAPLHQKALERRLHVMAMCVVVNLIRDGYSRQFVYDKLQRLRHLGYYPLPPCRGIRRYGWIRLLTRYPWCVAAIHSILRRS